MFKYLKSKVMSTIINSETSFNDTLSFLKCYFQNVMVVSDKQSYFSPSTKIILFENRNVTFSIKWDYDYSILYLGNITENNKSVFQYTFTKMKIDFFYPVEIGNNYNVVFWMYDSSNSHSDMSVELCPLRLPVTINESTKTVKK